MKYKVGDWVVYNYRIHQVMEINENGQPRELSTGYIRCSSNELEVRPLTLKSKVMAERIEELYGQLRKLPGSNSLNYPDISRYFAILCFDAIDDETEYQEGDYSKDLKLAEEFVRKTRDALTSVPEVDGVRLFRN